MVDQNDKIYSRESSALTRSRGKLACLFGITLVPIFSGLDYFLVPSLWLSFLVLRSANTIENLIIYGLLHYKRDLSRRQLNFLITLYFCSISIMIAYMCRLMGGYHSPYYAGINLVMLAVSLLMPWGARYTVLNGMIMYVAYLALGYSPDFAVPHLLNSSYFLVSTILVASIASFWTEASRRKEFLLRQELKELDQAKSAFFANVSHELKTPMTLVVTPLENVLQKVPKGAPEVILSRETFESVRHNAYRLSGLISDLLDLTKGEIGKARISPVEVEDAQGYFEKIFSSVAPLMQEKGLVGEFEGTGVRGHFFDTSKIDKVVVNLLSNAIKFTPKGGKITMRVWDLPAEASAKAGGGVLKIQVTDTGIGIPADKLPQIFERFMQVDASSTRAYGGMGIGLSLVKDFVEQHGGSVEVQSEIGKGTTFIVTLPRGKEHFRAMVVEEKEGDIGKGIELPPASLVETMHEVKWEVEKEAGLPAEALAKAGEGETVLVVDDTPDMRRAVWEILRDKYRVLFGKDGEEGVAIARAKKPDLILSDVMMPKKDGYGLLQDLKKDPETREIPIILLTAKSGEENLALGFSFGADDYIAKPFQPKEVLSRVRNLVRMRRQKEEIARQRDDLEKLNKELKEAEAELIQTAKLSSIGLLAAGVAHEISNPAYSLNLSIANIEGLLEETRGRAIPTENLDRLQHHLERSHEEVERIQKLVKTLLNYSRKNREGIAWGPIRQDLDSTLALLKKQIEDAGTAVHWNGTHTDEDSSRTSIEADHASLNQIFTNLIQNSIQAGSKNIWIDADVDEATCRIRVADDGSGIPSEVVPHIFEPFFTTKKVGDGSGLGLNIVHRIVKAHHGEVMVASQVGKGTEFRIILPIRQPHDDVRPSVPPSPLTASSNRV